MGKKTPKRSTAKGSSNACRSDLEEQFLAMLESLGGSLSKGVRTNYIPYDDAKFEIDFAWPEILVAVEIDGGTFTRGKHTRGTGYDIDCQKRNRLTSDGWRVLVFTTTDLKKRSRIVLPLLRTIKIASRG